MRLHYLTFDCLAGANEKFFLKASRMLIPITVTG